MQKTYRQAWIHLSVAWICIEDERREYEARSEPRRWLPSCLTHIAPQQQPSSSLCWQRMGTVGWFQFTPSSCSPLCTHTSKVKLTTIHQRTVSGLPHSHSTHARRTLALCILCILKLSTHDIHRQHTRFNIAPLFSACESIYSLMLSAEVSGSGPDKTRQAK